MSGPPQFFNHAIPGRLAPGESKGPQEVKLSEVKHVSAHTSQKNNPVVCFDPSLEEVLPTRKPIMSHKRAADITHPDLAGLLVRNKSLLAELKNVQNKLVIKESSLQEMKSELESYKENNVQQSFQIMSLKDDIKDLEKLTAFLTRIKSLKNINIQNLERGNWDLTERIIELENRLRVHLVEREKAEQKADLLEKKLAGGSRFSPHINIKGKEDFLDSFMMKEKGEAILAKNIEQDIFYSEGPKHIQKIWDKCQQDSFHKEKQKYELARPPCPFSWETKTVESHYQKLLGELATLLSNSADPIPATEEAVKGKIRDISANEQSWKFRTEGLQQEIQMLTERLDQLHQHYKACAHKLSQTEKKCREQKRPLKHLEGKTATTDFFQRRSELDRDKENSETNNSQIDKHRIVKQLEKDSKQQTLWNIQQNLQIATTQKLEEKIQKLQKQLSDLKLTNKNMKTQLTRVNILKDKTIEKLRQSLTKIETMKGKAVMKTDNLKTTLDSAEQETRRDRERARQTLDTVTSELCTSKSPCEELVDFRETIMKMLGFNKKAANKEIINHLKLLIQAHETSKKSKIASECETGKDNE